jgi:hypothetical protein
MIAAGGPPLRGTTATGSGASSKCWHRGATVTQATSSLLVAAGQRRRSSPPPPASRGALKPACAPDAGDLTRVTTVTHAAPESLTSNPPGTGPVPPLAQSSLEMLLGLEMLLFSAAAFSVPWQVAPPASSATPTCQQWSATRACSVRPRSNWLWTSAAQIRPNRVMESSLYASAEGVTF